MIYVILRRRPQLACEGRTSSLSLLSLMVLRRSVGDQWVFRYTFNQRGISSNMIVLVRETLLFDYLVNPVVHSHNSTAGLAYFHRFSEAVWGYRTTFFFRDGRVGFIVSRLLVFRAFCDTVPVLLHQSCFLTRLRLRCHHTMIRTQRMSRTIYYFNTTEVIQSSRTEVPDVALL